MQTPGVFSKQASQSAARLVDEMSRLYYLSRAIHVAAELGVADLLGQTSVGLDELAQMTKSSAPYLKRLVRFLSGYGIFEVSPQDRISNTPLSSVLSSDHPNSVSASVLRIGSFWWSAVGDMEHSIRTGESAFTHVHGVPFFRYLKAHPDIQKRFDVAMARISDADDAAVAAAYDFTRFRRIVDVGGGRGGLLVQILKQAPDAIGVLFEQPQVLEQATRLVDAGLKVRSEMVAGDIFKSMPAGADCYVIKGVLHDFDDGDCVKILTNCAKAMTVDGRVVIANLDIPEQIDGPHPNLTMDIQMMTLLRGRERTITEWSVLLRRSGFSVCNTFQTNFGFVLVEAKPD